jgi:hypothetical protein
MEAVNESLGDKACNEDEPVLVILLAKICHGRTYRSAAPRQPAEW